MFLLFFILTNTLPVESFFHNYRASGLNGSLNYWTVYYEGVDESKYRFYFGKNVSGFEISLYIICSGNDINRDFIRFTFVGENVTVSDSSGTYKVESIVGVARVGFDNDSKISVGKGRNLIYYVLPRKCFVSYINITLFSRACFPKLNLFLSTVREWDPLVHYVPILVWSQGWAVADMSGGTRGRAAVLSSGANVPVGCPSESGVFYVFGKGFKPPKVSGKPDVYVDFSYLGGFNAAPESFAGKGNYRCKIDAGVGAGSTLNEAYYSGLNHTLYLKQKYTSETAIPLIVQDSAKGSIDIFLEVGKKVFESGLAKEILSALGYVSFAYDIIQLLLSLGFDETVTDAKILVWQNVNIDLDKEFYAYCSLVCQTKSAGLTGTIANFYGESPWGRPLLEGLFGSRIFELPSGGMSVGGILLHYYIPVVENVSPLGENMPVNTKITLKFSKPIDRGTIVKSPGTIVATANSKPIDFFDFFHFRDSGPELMELVMSPNYHLDYGTRYVINFTSKILDVYGFGLEPFTITFSTQPAQFHPKNIYYNISIVDGLYEFGSSLRGEIFKAKIVEYNMTLREPMGFATIRTNDPLYDYWNEGACNVFKVGDKIYCKLSVARDGGVPPRSSTVFELTDKASIRTQAQAEAEVIEVNPKKISRANVEKIMEQTGLKHGVRFTLEPIYVKEYSTLGEYFGKIKFYSDEVKTLDERELNIYVILHVAQWDLIPEKPPAYYVNFGGPASVPVDFVTYYVSGEFVGAWRLIPLFTENRHYTYNFTVNFQGTDREVYLLTNSTISNFYYNRTIEAISFTVGGKNGTRGFIKLGLPRDMVKATPKVFFDSVQVPFKVEESDQRYWIYLEYFNSQHHIIILLAPAATETPLQPQPYTLYIVAIPVAFSIIALIALKKRRRK